MSKTKLFDLIKATHVSEKSMLMTEKTNSVVFKVTTVATKHQIKDAVEKFFNVQVEKVRTLKVKGKKKTYRQRVGVQKDFKKAYVTLKEGQQIDFFNAE